MELKLLSGLDYPNTYREFVKMFPDNIACANFIKRLRWPKGFTCPKCETLSETWNESRNRLECTNCHHQTYLTAGTIFEKTRTPLITWFEAAWHLTTAKNGMSAKTLESTIGVSYRTAWMILQRFRVAMVNSERKQLTGIIEIDESLVGGVGIGGKRGRGSNKSIVVIAIEILQPKGFGRVRMRYVPNASSNSLLTFVHDVVAPGSELHTDGWSSYIKLSESESGYTHKVTVQSSSDDPAHVSMPGVHRIASLLKRWILGTHQGSIANEHLQAYLEEFTFRFNRRKSRSRGLVFRRLLEQSVITGAITEKDVTHGYDWD